MPHVLSSADTLPPATVSLRKDSASVGIVIHCQILLNRQLNFRAAHTELNNTHCIHELLEFFEEGQL